MCIFSEEQGIKIPDDDDGGFNDEYKPSHPNFSSHFDHSGFGGVSTIENSIPPPLTNNAYQRPDVQGYPQNNYPKKNVDGHRTSSIPPPLINNAYQRPGTHGYPQNNYPKKDSDGYRPGSLPPPSNSNTYQRPDGPDYSQIDYHNLGSPNGHRKNNRGSTNKKPLTIGLDVYPVIGKHDRNTHSQQT